MTELIIAHEQLCFFLSFFLAMPWVLTSPEMLSAYPLCASVFICGHRVQHSRTHPLPQMTPLVIPAQPNVKGAIIGTLWHLGYSFILIYAASAGRRARRAGWG
jgi:hypothetical protein